MPNGWCITTMTYRCSWLRLMVASAGEADRFSMKTRCPPLVLFACYAQRWYPSSVHLGCVGDVVVFHVGGILSQNWMAIVVPPHCPLPRGSSFLELDYWEETDHSEDLSNFIGASPKLDAKWMMHHHDDLSMLMVASAGEADRFLTKNKLYPQRLYPFSPPSLRWRRGRLSRWCNFMTQLAMNQMFPRRSIDVGTKSKSFVLISKPSHKFVFNYPVILFV